MICRNCGKELPDLALYCPSCGFKQFGTTETEPVVLELADPASSKVIIDAVHNRTAALSSLKKITGLEISEISRILSDLPHVIRSSMSRETAEALAAKLKEQGIEAHVSGPGQEQEITQLRSTETE